MISGKQVLCGDHGSPVAVVAKEEPLSFDSFPKDGGKSIDFGRLSFGSRRFRRSVFSSYYTVLYEVCYSSTRMTLPREET